MRIFIDCVFFFPPFCNRMLKSKAQIAQEKTLRASRALKWALDSGHKGLQALST